MKNLEYYINEKINKFTIIEIIKKNKRNYFRCKCECGNIREIAPYYIFNNKYKSCGKCSLNNSNERFIYKDNETPIHRIYRHYFNRHIKKHKDSPFIDYEKFKKLIKSECFYCGIKQSSYISTKEEKFYYNGIDRINSNLGYTNENSTVCCHFCNRAKNIMTQKEYYNFIKRVYNFNKGKKIK